MTVKESLFYASKLQNNSEVDHKSNVEDVGRLLDIENCLDLRPKRCSGGQKKRISIALELMSRPDILILDEPTTGLDSVTTWQLINTLISLSQMSPPMAIVATIHQPSGKLFNLFNSVYIMSPGQCLYHGTPQTLVNFFRLYGLYCPPFHNPSDYALEVASNEHGVGNVMRLTTIMKIEALDLIPYQYQLQVSRQHRTFTHIWILFKRYSFFTTISILRALPLLPLRRTFKQSIRDVWMIPLRIAAHIAFTVMIVLFWGSGSGKLSGCPQDFVEEGTSYLESYDRVSEELNENMSCVLFMLMNIWFGAIVSVLLTFPKEMNIFLKEYRNGWFSCFSYYSASVLVDIFLQLTIPNIMSVPTFIFTGQDWEEEWRLYYFIVICILIALTTSSMGLLVSAYLMNYPTAAVFIGSIMGFPLLLFSGFMISVKNMPEPFQWLTYINFIRFGLQAGIADIYGFDRCMGRTLNSNTSQSTDFIPKDKINEILSSDKLNGKAVMTTLSLLGGQVFNDTESAIMKKLEFVDNDLYFGIGMLSLLMVLFKTITYFVLLRKVKTIT